MKKILIILTEEPKPRNLDFFNRIKNYLDDKGQNEVFIYKLGNINPKKSQGRYFASVESLIFFIKKYKIEVLACNSPLEDATIKKIKRRVFVVGALNFKGNDDYDFRIFITDYSESAMIEFAQKLSIVDKLNWDSRFFGINIARLNHTLINENILKLTLKVCKQLAIKCLYFRSDSDSIKNIELSEKNGFHLANIRVTYVLEKVRSFRKFGKDYVLRQGKKRDIPWLIDISRDAYTKSRYYFDKNFSREICDQFYIEWVKKIANSSASGEKIFILEKNNKPIAYIGSIVVRDAVEIELIAVDSAYRGQGIGKKIISEFIRNYQKAGQRRFRVVTQGRNIAALRLYQACGFEITEEQLDYHKWF